MIANKALESSILDVLNRIEKAAEKTGKSAKEISLVLVTKLKAPELIESAAAILNNYNIDIQIGENYLQEFQNKKQFLQFNYTSHFIGRLQSNKIEKTLDLFDIVQSCSSYKILDIMEKLLVVKGIKKKIFVQVNISDDPGKAGFLPADINHLLSVWDKRYSHLSLQGLMTITYNYDNPELIRSDYRQMKILADELVTDPAKKEVFADSVCRLSMGMSGDFEIAIEEGADIVRIGSAILGERG